ncbi:MAG: hypothetical protein N2439_05025, partial [Anaerolineae bacterium]|nr:hypothetical protein [Anaerolineae bacterium]
PQRPRKQDPACAQALAWFLRRGRALGGTRAELAELVYLGDTKLADGNAFRNLRAAGGWRGWAFIGAERDESLAVDIKDDIFFANRWNALAEFAGWMLSEGAALDRRTAVIIDIDKTALGARGRNDIAIDRARLAAIEATVAAALGSAFDQEAFRRAYAAIIPPKYHAFTADNQDYVAYLCLMIGAGFITLAELLRQIETGELPGFHDFIARVDARQDALPDAALRALHREIYARVQAGDATPFKAFRRREYIETVGRMGHLPDDAPLGQRLVEEICLTREVFDFGRWLRDRGCLLMAVSDKPDEASLPTPELVAEGYLPLHRTKTHIVGQGLAELLPGS